MSLRHGSCNLLNTTRNNCLYKILGGIVILFANIAWCRAAPSEHDYGCDSSIADPEVKFFDVRLAKTEIPDTLTTYVCQSNVIPLEHNEEYHAVAFKALIGNVDTVHHMLMFGCEKSYLSDRAQAAAHLPHTCGASDYSCRSFLAQWSRGTDQRICSPPNAGVRFGFRSFTTLALQIHWNNANKSAGLTDTSGFRVYYTKRIRQYDLGNFQIGQNDLEIPPGQGRYTQTGGCSSECTSQWIQDPIYLTRAHLHMHTIGDGGSIQIVRGGEVIQEIINDDQYDYNNPPVHIFEVPIQVKSGDELRLNCFFNTRDGSKKRNRTIYWGEGSDGEMCYAFITYYPKIQDFDQCINFDTYDVCIQPGMVPALGDCVFQGFAHTFESGMRREILDHCTREDHQPGDTHLLCSSACLGAIREVTEHPCMQGRLEKYSRRVVLPEVAQWKQVSHIIAEAAAKCH